MTGSGSEDIDRFVKANWLAFGLSQSDLAEALGAALRQVPAEGDGSTKATDGRLGQIADALGFAATYARYAEPGLDEPGKQSGGSLQSLLDLRLLRAFRELKHPRSKRMLICLAEQMLKRQADRRD